MPVLTKLGRGSIRDSAISTATLEDGSVAAVDIGADAVTSAAIATGAVIADGIGADAVTSAAIATGAVIADGIGAGAVTTAKIANDAVSTDQIANNASISTSGNIATTGSGTLTVAGAITASGGIANAGTITAGTIGTSVVFPAGHIIQSVFSPSITNTSTANTTSQTAVGRADVIGQITITSGNGVLVYCQAWMNADRATNAYGTVQINEGTVASLGTKLSEQFWGSSQGDVYGSCNLWAYDSSPADTTPDYAIAIAKASGATANVSIQAFDAENFKIFLFEVKQ